MAIQPIETYCEIYYEGEDETSILQSCDSVMAVMTRQQADEWIEMFKIISKADNAQDYCDFGTITRIFDIDGQTIVMVSDGGGELAVGEFQEFCENNSIMHQFIIDSPDCEGVDIDDVYTGQVDNNPTLVALWHKIYN